MKNSGPFIDLVLKEFLAQLSPFQPRIQRIVLFGSRARGQELPDSDYDILFVVDRRSSELRQGIFMAAVEMELKHGAVISPKIYALDDFNRLSAIPTPFLKNVLKDGVDLDQAA